LFKDNLLANKRILITGGGSGLGKSIAGHILKLGAHPIICGRRESVLKATADELMREWGGSVSWFPLDVRDADMVERVVDQAWQEGPIDGLINGAAGNFLARTETLSHRAMDAVIKIVLHGSAYMTLACGKRWIAEKRQGNVISIVTTYAWTGSAYVVPSAMAKAGVLSMTRSLAVEWGPKAIRLNAIAPGPFPTKGAWDRLVPTDELANIWETRNPLGRTGEHNELTSLVVYMLADQSAYINGEVITIDGGEWLAGAGQFNFAKVLTDDDWDKVGNLGRKK